MGYYLIDHPPNSRQFYPYRRRFAGVIGVSGCVVVHTAEGVMDDVGVDTGAENVAHHISTRNTAGTYHELVDSDSHVMLVPDEWEAFHVGANGHNRHAWGISAACRTEDWHPDHWWTQRTISRMGERICAFWQRQGLDPVVSARWISRDEALTRRPGLVCHGTLQPTDRSDAWVRQPHREALERMLVDAIVAAAGVPPKEDELTPEQMTELKGYIDAKVATLDQRILTHVNGVNDGVKAEVERLAEAGRRHSKKMADSIKADIERLER